VTRGILAIMLAAILSGCSPPGMLNGLDRISGGGSGVERVAEGVAFGTQGQMLDVWRPEGKADRPRPVLIFWHGGGWVKGKRQEYGFAGRAYASRGFIVVVADYRKVPGVRFPAFVQDGAQAVKWVRDNIAEYGGDPNRVALAGHSAGAYSVAMIALDKRWLQAEGVDPGIIKAGVGLSGPYDFYPFTGRAVEAMKTAADPMMTQPIAFARKDAPPLLLVTSSKDTVVRPRNAVNLTKKLRSLGAPVEYANYPGLTHEEVMMAVSKPFRGKATVLDDTTAFLNRALAVREP
jgi:acetyl esterase/lipase